MNLTFHQQMPNDEGRMAHTRHSTFAGLAKASEQRGGVRHSLAIRYLRVGRRSPGRKALFSPFHPAPASWTAAAGFTLIEVLLALGVCAIVLVAISSIFAGALRLQEHAAANLDQSLPIERAMNLMRRDLKNAVPPGGLLAGPMQSGSLLGGVDANDGIQIYTTTGLMTPNTPWSEIQKITYGLQAPADSTNGGKDLIRTVTRNLLSTTTEDEDDQFLASGVQSLNFSYFDGQNWLDTWDDTVETNLPVAVRVSVQLVAKDSTQDPAAPLQLLVPLMAQVHTNELDNSDSDTNNSTGGPGGN
ncbi:MAG TPA: type II secretion system protein GspJ [Verrucomicrobiae bacterium]|jgi:general secretion pathway protein J|nr:type II secretion system protein GspJ [Verrucomicrobiae bacterium]